MPKRLICAVARPLPNVCFHGCTQLFPTDVGRYGFYSPRYQRRRQQPAGGRRSGGSGYFAPAQHGALSRRSFASDGRPGQEHQAHPGRPKRQENLWRHGPTQSGHPGSGGRRPLRSGNLGANGAHVPHARRQHHGHPAGQAPLPHCGDRGRQAVPESQN